MHIIATFKQNMNLELAIAVLKRQGIPDDHIFATVLQQRKPPGRIMDTINRSDGVSTFDLACILGTTFMLLGSIYGYILAWGPIIWGIIGAVTGLSLGFLITLWRFKFRNTDMKAVSDQVVVMIRCGENEGNELEELLWDLHAQGITQVKKNMHQHTGLCK